MKTLPSRRPFQFKVFTVSNTVSEDVCTNTFPSQTLWHRDVIWTNGLGNNCFKISVWKLQSLLKWEHHSTLIKSRKMSYFLLKTFPPTEVC